MSIQRYPKFLVPLRYTGGKANVLSSLHEQVPTQFDEFRDCFVGGGSFALSMMWRNKTAKYWLNDANPLVYNVWKQIHRNAPKMQKWIWAKKVQYAKGGFKGLFLWCRANIRSADDFEQGCMWYIMNRLSFNGMGESYTGGKHFNDGKITDLKYCGALMKSVDLTITNYDYSVLSSSSRKQVVLFMDPPYAMGKKYYYGSLHRKFDHDVFALVVKDIRHKWVITYNDTQEVRRRFEGFKTAPLRMMYSNEGERVTELIIKNF